MEPERIPQGVALRVSLEALLAGTKTPATGLTDVAVKLSKNGAAFADPGAGATNATEIGSGWYYVDLSAADSGTLGPLLVRGTQGTIDPAEVVLRVVNAHHAGFDGLPDAAAADVGGVVAQSNRLAFTDQRGTDGRAGPEFVVATLSRGRRRRRADPSRLTH